MDGIVQVISFVGRVLFDLVGAVSSWAWNTPWYELLAMLVGIGLIRATLHSARS